MKGEVRDNLGPDAQRALQLISAYCDERITAEEASELESMVISDIEICRLYVRVMDLNAGLYQYASALGFAENNEANGIERWGLNRPRTG